MEPLTELWCVTGNDLCFKVELLWHHFVAMAFQHHGCLLNEHSASRVSWFNNNFHESELQLRGTFIKSVLILKLRTCSFSFNYVIPYGTSSTRRDRASFVLLWWNWYCLWHMQGPECCRGLNIRSAWIEETSSTRGVYPEPQHVHKHSDTKEGILH